MKTNRGNKRQKQNLNYEQTVTFLLENYNISMKFENLFQ